VELKDALAVIAIIISILSFVATFVFNIRKGVFDRRPVLTFVDNGKVWELRNIGNGPARHVIVQQKRVSGPDSGTWFDPVLLPDMGKDERYALTWLGRVNDVGLGATYRDMSERITYATRASDDKNVVARLGKDNRMPKELRGLREPQAGLTPHWQAEAKSRY
jgi:hypothetical protein